MKTTKGCPICDRPAQADHAPFCSQGCRDRDLLRWLGEGYRLPGRPADPMEMDGLDRGDSRD
ncbi:DNA gyrase inhibitor YacG [Sphingomonas spermidinifaciens]|uniref:DNA gyrase inhibitor YacG n=1 Tax=Sphingomonas spermidinifaciens TaxID=1141889 RepID=A0A2A4B9H6_9SPHN|nr:DNA gyrase inhibitor YacG [Sphingomonas spermidinifaciens]PCD04439.1 DNA gyrase inhibitor YacG [Sphingomonas spermidinifaciens]